MKNIDYQLLQQRYLEYAENQSELEIDIMEKFGAFLPDEIIDAHTHYNDFKFLLDVPPTLSAHLVSSFLGFNIGDSDKFNALLYPEKKVHCLRIPLPFQGINLKSVNDHLLSVSYSEHRVAVAGIPTDLVYTLDVLKNGNVSALKMYHWYSHPPYKEIYDFFSPEILEVTQSGNVPIILHLPGTLAKCEECLVRLLLDFPRQRVVVAHMGVSATSTLDDLEIYRKLSRYENLFMDTSMVIDPMVLTQIFKRFPLQRIMYGTDLPLSLVRGQAYRHPEFGLRIFSSYPYHWINPREVDEQGVELCGVSPMLIHWQALLSLENAIRVVAKKQQEKVKEMIFFNTAKEVYSF